MLRGRAGGRAELETKLLELQGDAGVQRAVRQIGLGQTDRRVRKEDRLGQQMLALVHLRQAVVPVEVFRLGHRQF